MKLKKIEALPVPRTRKRGWCVKAQLCEDVLVLDVFCNGSRFSRHAVNVNTSEYATLYPGRGTGWTGQKIEAAIGLEEYEYGQQYYLSPTAKRKIDERWRPSKEDEELIRSAFPQKHTWRSDPDTMVLISDRESAYGRQKRINTEDRRCDRVRRMMQRVPEIPDGFLEWIDEKLCGRKHYALRSDGAYSCSACGQTFEAPGKVKNHEEITCPHCGGKLIVENRKKLIVFEEHVCIIQPIDEEVSVLREFWACVEMKPERQKAVGAEENARVILFKQPKKEDCSIYWAQGYRSKVREGTFVADNFDNKSNPYGIRIHPEHTFDGGIREALQGTAYEDCTHVIELAAGLRADANKILYAGKKSPDFLAVMELLAKGRFYRLFAETSKRVEFWGTWYRGELDLRGGSIEEVFQIYDRQKINRIRDMNGGEEMLGWMQWLDDTVGIKISAEFLRWAEGLHLSPQECSLTLEYLKPEQMMHYITRQKLESYPTKNMRTVIGQYEDYLNMEQKLGKNLGDEMVYRPRELKRRHDEAVVELEMNRVKIDAAEYRKRFPDAQKNIRKVARKYTYEGDKFLIRVPKELYEVVMEGRALHHCAGSSDRYFDRMSRNETYICFLRRKDEPEIPFYTIEVEPGGTIRQHRGLYDEEPEIETVKPFLREWQKVIRSRMKEEDHKLAKMSAKKREENILELKARNNTRVLEGLMEDFMEAINE